MFYLIIFMFIKFTYYRLIYISKFNYEKYKKILSAYKSLIVISHELVSYKRKNFDKSSSYHLTL